MTVGGNYIELLKNGDEIFPAMLEAIRSARDNICFETYVYWDGDIAEEFAEALCERSEAGVLVHVLIDWYGSMRMDERLVGSMEASGVEVERFRPLKWFNFRRANHRTHRKLLIVDGSIAFTGGVGIAQEWTGDAQDPHHWRDNHYRIRGPIVTEVQRAFFTNWRRAGHRVADRADDSYFPTLERIGDAAAEIVAASPANGRDGIYHLFEQAVTEAEDSLDLSTAYFVPSRELIGSLIAASERGVRVRLLICGEHIDETLVRYASRASWGKLLAAGVRIYEYEPTLYHVKAITVDDKWTSVGSANFDVRSCRINDELNIVVRDPGFAQLHTDLFEKDCHSAREITFEVWQSRPLLRKILDRLAQTFRHQL